MSQADTPPVIRLYAGFPQDQDEKCSLLCYCRPFTDTTVPARFMIEEEANAKVTQGTVQ